MSKYNSSSDGFPTDYMFESMAQTGLVAMLMLDYVIPSDTEKIDEEHKPIVIRACKNLIDMKKVWMGLKSYTVDFSGGIETHPVSKQFN